MATFTDHILQGKSNLAFLSNINRDVNGYWDWQVTTCFYVACHFMSAHVVNKTNKNYLSHTSVSDVINPTRVLSVGKIDEATYLSYTKLYQLSRRSRYLINEKVAQNKGGAPQPDIQPCNLTYSTHFRKAVSHLEVVMNFMAKEYALTFSKTDLKCVDLNGMAFNYFNVLA